MSGFVIGGKVVPGPPGIPVYSWLDDPEMRVHPGDMRVRKNPWVHMGVLHTTVGDEPQVILPGAGPGGHAKRTVRAWRDDPDHAGSHIVVDDDGTVWCVADLLLEATYHATSVNEVSFGVELCQTNRLEIRQVQIDALCQVGVRGILDVVTEVLSIQRQFHAPYRGSSRPVARLASGGEDCVGIFGHRDQTTRRGAGDPGDAVFARLAECGYEAFDFARSLDRDVWRGRQATAGVVADGVPGPHTCAALRHTIGRATWVRRPGDAP